MPVAGALAPPRLGGSPTCCAKHLGIEVRAMASWMERIKAGQTVLNDHRPDRGRSRTPFVTRDARPIYEIN
jgi:hypothetical protein